MIDDKRKVTKAMVASTFHIRPHGPNVQACITNKPNLAFLPIVLYWLAHAPSIKPNAVKTDGDGDFRNGQAVYIKFIAHKVQ